MSDRRVLVIGGGIAALAAAVELVDDPSCTVEVRESADRLGGKICTSSFGGVDHVDEGADAYLTRVPQAAEFARRVGVTDEQLTSPTDAKASIWHNGLHDVPGGVLLGVPAAVRPFVASDLLTRRGKLRAAAEPFIPRTDPHDSLGALIRARFGDEVHERLVDALVGSIYATDTDRSSLAAIPQLAELAAQHRSLLLGARTLRRRRPISSAGDPIFATPSTGMIAIVDAAADHIVGRGGKIHTGRPVGVVETDAGQWRVDDEPFDAIVLATPADVAGQLLRGAADDAADELGRFDQADVIMVRLTVAGGDWPERLAGRSGYLVPKPDQRHVTAASFGSQKWAHWRPDDGRQILRVSLGRDGLTVMHLDDDAVRAATVDELSRHLCIDVQPVEFSLTRWHRAFPQYRPHHHERVARIEHDLPPGLALAGASYHGIGIPACIASGRRAASTVRTAQAFGGVDVS